jgi:hypothetical protein
MRVKNGRTAVPQSAERAGVARLDVTRAEWIQSLLRKKSPPGSRLGLDATAHELAELQDVAVRESVIDMEPIAMAGDEAKLVQPGEVLGRIGLREAGVIDQVSDRTLAISESVQ